MDHVHSHRHPDILAAGNAVTLQSRNGKSRSRKLRFLARGRGVCTPVHGCCLIVLNRWKEDMARSTTHLYKVTQHCNTSCEHTQQHPGSKTAHIISVNPSHVFKFSNDISYNILTYHIISVMCLPIRTHKPLARMHERTWTHTHTHTHTQTHTRTMLRNKLWVE